MVTNLDCRTCGACCVGAWDDGFGWADCTTDDVKRMSRAVRAKLQQTRNATGHGDWLESAAYVTPATFHDGVGYVCNFLRGTPGRRVSCGIYATRPDVCRKFNPGSRACLESRKEFGL